MAEITMSEDQLAVFSAHYTGPRDVIVYIDGVLVVPDDLEAEIRAIDLSSPGNALSGIKASKIAELTARCQAEIIAGYSSSALGSPHAYPSGITDQINMMGSVTASLLPNLPANWTTPFWCRTGEGTWVFEAHTAAQIQQAGSDGKAHVVACQATLEGLSASVNSATSTEAIAAVDWP